MVVLVQSARHGPLHKQVPVLWLINLLQKQLGLYLGSAVSDAYDN